ncbi:uncharacterized protein [Lolium perenne]|uniref:uncharacterized protein isoform X1 n=1 Tax=Lolium perenne TaxID=4522 RepID=UPI0021F5E8F2|nr:ubiquitin-like-specific protease 1D isoform X1 [Lolium perenne]
MATASPEPLSSGQEGDEDDEVRLDDESDQALKEKLQRIQYGLNKFIPPDGGKKYRLLRDSINRELARRQAARSASASPQPRPSRPPGRQGEPQDNSRCERIIQSRHAESSGLPSDCNENHGVTKSDFFSAFKVDDEAGLNLSRMEITSASPSKPKTSVESEGKFCEVDESCETDGQPICLSTKKVSYMDNSIDLENLSPGDAFKDNGHTRIHEHASTPSRKRKGDDPGAFSMRLRSRKVQEVVLLDGDARHSESADKITNKWDAMKIYYPSSEHPQSVELSHDDIKCLEPESLLSSPIMNFYIMYLQQPMSSISIPKGKCHIFNTYFFSKLEALISKVDKASYFLKLRRWWKGIDIFKKAYILFPVHADTHWSLVIICMPSKEDQSGLIILHLDSLKFHRSRHIFSVVERFLKEEWSYLNKNGSLEECPIQEMVWKNLPRKIEKKPIAVPQQENEYDCGLFVLYYMQRFIEQAPERIHKKDLSMFGKRWFQPEEASALRTKIQSVLLQLFHEAKPNNNTPEQQTTGPSLVEAKSKNNLMEPTVPEQPVEGSSAKLASPNHLDGSSIQPTSFEHPLECS